MGFHTIDKPEAIRIMDGITTVNLECASNDCKSSTWINEKQLAKATKTITVQNVRTCKRDFPVDFPVGQGGGGDNFKEAPETEYIP